MGMLDWRYSSHSPSSVHAPSPSTASTVTASVPVLQIRCVVPFDQSISQNEENLVARSPSSFNLSYNFTCKIICRWLKYGHCYFNTVVYSHIQYTPHLLVMNANQLSNL